MPFSQSYGWRVHFLYFPFHLTFPSFPLGKSGLVALLLRREAYVSAGLRLAKVGRLLLLLLIFASLSNEQFGTLRPT